MEIQKINTPFGRVNVRQSGEGFPCIAVHGILSSSATFTSLLEMATENRVIAIDLPGYGASDGVEGFSPGWKGYAAVLDAVVDALDFRRFDLLGHSLGGGVAAYYAGTRPDRVRKLVLADSVTARFQLPFKGKIPQVPILGDYIFMKIYGEEMFMEYFTENVFNDPSRIDKDRIAEYYTSFNRNRASTLKAIRATANPMPVVKVLRNIHASTLVLWGECDPLIPMSVGAETHRILRSSRFAVIPDCGHSPFEESPTRTSETVLSFLR